MTRPGQDEDFASAAMMRVVAAGLGRLGVSMSLPEAPGARVPRSRKRDALRALLDAHGPTAVLSLADGARDLPPEPVALALKRARDVSDLLDRWGRLERFGHARHTLNSERFADGSFRLTHRARDAGPPPSPAESLLVFGLIVVLSEMIGARDVTLSTEAGEVWRRHGAWGAPSAREEYGSLRLSAAPGSAGPPGGDDPGAEDLVFELRRRIGTDPVRRWSLEKLAADAGIPTRTLQRRLTYKATCFSRIVAEARLQVAAFNLLEARGLSLAEIGFLAGYSDQAHFARSFKHAVGTTPSAFRADFRA